MKKILGLFISVLLLVTVIGLPVFAADEDVVFTIGEVTGKPGDIVSVPVTVVTNGDVIYNSIGLRDLVYDETVLSFVDFADTEEILAKCLFGAFDSEKQVVTLALKQDGTISGPLCSIRFRILADVQDGSFSVSASSIIKQNSIELTSSVVPGVVQSKHVHDMTHTAAVDATCVAEGNVENYYCSFCKTYYADVEGAEVIADVVLPVDPDNHDFGDGNWTTDGNAHWHFCLLCEGEFDKVDHTGGEATCAAKAVCEVCTVGYGETDGDNHTGGTELRGVEEYHCVTGGYTGDTHCLGCDVVLEEGGRLDPTGECVPESQRRDVVEVSHEADGYTGDLYCSICNRLIDEGEIIPQIQVAYTFADTKARVGQTFRVPLTVVSDTEIDSIGIRLDYDASIFTFVGFEDIDEISGKCMLYAFDDVNATISLGLKQPEVLTGKICTLVFKVNEGVEDCTSVITMITGNEDGDASVTKKGSEEIGFEVDGAEIEVTNYLLGDVNLDGGVDIADALALFRYSMMPDLYKLDYPGDMNFDNDSKGNLDINDALRLFQYSLMPDMYPLFPTAK